MHFIGIIAKKLLEIDNLTESIVNDIYSFHLPKRIFVGIIKDSNLAVRRILPYTSYRSTREYRRVEMDDTDVLLHNKNRGQRT